MAETKSKFRDKLSPELQEVLKDAINHGQTFWDNYYGPLDDVYGMWLDDEQATNKLNTLLEKGQLTNG